MLKFIYIVLCSLFLFIAESYSIISIYNSLFTNLLIHIWVISNFGLLWIKLQWIFIIYRSLYEFFSLILGKYQRLELLRYILCVQLQKELSHRLQTDCAILYSHSMYKNCYYMIYILILAIVFIRVLQRNSTNLRRVCAHTYIYRERWFK